MTTVITAVVEARRAALEPLRAALITRARAEAARIQAAADADAQQVMAAARDEAAAVLARARAEGEAEAGAMLATEAARSRQVARGLVLDAQRAAYDELRERARSAVRGLLEAPDRRARLAASLRARLGDQGTVRDHPDGGLLAETDDGRSIDASIGALVDADVSGKDVEQLWDTR
jgi:vacuolar-type H+-ATPase subunit E/Vma4